MSRFSCFGFVLSVVCGIFSLVVRYFLFFACFFFLLVMTSLVLLCLSWSIFIVLVICDFWFIVVILCCCLRDVYSSVSMIFPGPVFDLFSFHTWCSFL